MISENYDMIVLKLCIAVVENDKIMPVHYAFTVLVTVACILGEVFMDFAATKYEVSQERCFNLCMVMIPNVEVNLTITVWVALTEF